MKAQQQTSSGAGKPAESPQGRRGQPLRSHLLGLVVLFVAAAVAGVLTGFIQAENDALSAARADAGFGARKTAAHLAENLTVVRTTVDALAANPGVGKVFTDPASCQLAFTLTGGAGAGHLDVLRPDGTVVCSSRPPNPAERGAYAGAGWLSAAQRSPQSAIPITDARTARPAVMVSAPIAGSGIVAAFVDLLALGAGSADLFGGARQLELLVLDAAGDTVLSRTPAGEGWIGRATGDTRFTAPDAAGAGMDVTGLRRIYGEATVPGLNWRVYAGAARTPALAAAHRLAMRQSLVVVVGLLAGLLATLLVYRRITQPISRLRAAVRSTAATGGSDLPAVGAGPREVVDLGAEFSSLFAAVGRQLAERRRAEELAVTHERNYRQMFDASPYPIYLFDVDTFAIVAANDAAVRYYGYPRDTLLTMTASRLLDDADTAALADADPVERGRRQRHVKQDGTVTDVTVTSYLVVFAGGEVRCVTVEDITEREQLERRLRQSERLESLGQLAGGIAHDFNNLLGIINGYAAMSAADVEAAAASDPAWRTLHDDLVQIVAAGDRAAALTRQLLAFARTDAVAEQRVVDLNSVVGDIDKLLQRTLGADIRLITRRTDEPWQIKADVGRLEQVLVNLAVNARDAMPNGGTLTIDTDRVTADEHYAAQYPGLRVGRYMRLRVSDTGTGMSKATLERAFEPFFTTKPKGEGTGLGLATIYGIITQAGGHAHIYSEPGRGTTVIALLPVTDEPVEAAQPARSPAQHGRGETILLVEDDDNLRTLTERILTRNGYTVLAAATPGEARQLAEARHVEVLLTDVVLPDEDGPSLAAALCADRPGTATIYMSGYAETILAARTALPPGATLLNKPITADHLLGAISRVIAARHHSASR